MKLSVLIVSYNTRERTLACLASLRAEMDVRPSEIIVFDNNSSDGSPDAIREAFPDVEVLSSDANLGFAGGCNRAAARAGGELLLFLNPDTLVLPGALSGIVHFAESLPGCGVYGGRTLFEDGLLDPTSVWRRMGVWSTFCHAVGLSSVFRESLVFDPETMGRWARDSVRQVDVVTGCFLLLTRAAWTDLGGFDEAFFMYGEEADLCLRAQALGYQPMFTPDATIVHVGGAVKQGSADKQVLLYRGRLGVAKRHMGAVAFFLVRHLVRAGTLMRALAAFGRSTRWPEVWRRRSEWQGGY